MELKINEFKTPAPITFNYEELKTAVQEKADEYASVVYTEDKVKDAKKDRAELNKLKDALNSERIRLQKEYMKPFEDYKAKTDELIGILEKPIGLIDRQIKDFDEKQKDEKKKEIELHFRTMEKPEFLQLNSVWNPKWLNKTYEMSKIRSELQEQVEKIQSDLATLSNLSEFGFEACEVYKSTLDLNKALNEGKRLVEIQKRKEEQERKRKEAEEARKKQEEERRRQEEERRRQAKVKKEEPVPQLPAGDFMNPPEPEKVLGVAEDVPLYPVAFRAYMTEEQSQELGQWFRERNIKFEPIR